MIKRLYNSWHIADQGERSADKLFTSLDGEILHVIHHLRISSFYHRTQLAGEIDFLVFSRPGLMVIEVKGGEIGYGDRTDGTTGYYKLAGSRTREAMDDPFIQADGNADAVQKYLMEKGLRNIFVGKMVCFPDCNFGRSGISIDFLWHRGCGRELSQMILESLEDQIGKFREDQKRKGITRLIDWKELEEEEIIRLCDELTPRFDPDIYRSLVRLNLAESDRRRKEGLVILKGLDSNKRIMIQGPPGSGKSTYAVDVIRRLACDEGRNGLYLCWNELLAEEMKQKLSDPELGIPQDRIMVKLYFDLACELGEKSGDKSLIPSKEVIKKGGLRQCVKGAVSKAGRRPDNSKYDFVIVDEAQDIFDKGIDFMLKALLKGNNPLENGSWYIFYDDSQDYPDGSDLDHYIRTRDMFRNQAASYNLTSSLRVNTGHGIDLFAQDAASGNIDTGKDYEQDVPSIVSYNGIEMKELPMGIATILNKKIAYSGGGYFRLLPYRTIKKIISSRDYNMTYFHLRDFDVQQKRKMNLRYFKNYYGINGSMDKFKILINDFEFINVENAARIIDWDTVPVVEI